MTLPMLPTLGLQYIYTSSACRVFTEALLRLPTCANARAMALDDNDDRYHCFVRLTDDTVVDAEGVASFDAFLAHFGYGDDVREVDALMSQVKAPSEHVQALEAHLRTLGWHEALPPFDDDNWLRDHWQKALDDFDTLGGWSGEPVDALRIADARAKRKIQRMRRKAA